MNSNTMPRKLIILAIILSSIFICWKFSKDIRSANPNWLLKFKNFPSSINQIDSLKSNALHIDTMKVSIDKEILFLIEEERKEICKTYKKTGRRNIKKHPYYDSFTNYKNYKTAVLIDYAWE